jgi:hypothetical protein
MGSLIAAYATENQSSTNKGTRLKINVTSTGESGSLDREYNFEDGDIQAPRVMRAAGLYSKMSSGEDMIVEAGYSWIVSSEYEISSDTTLEIASGGVMEIT